MSIKYVDRDGKIFEGDYDLMIARHTTSHVMAQAVKRLYPSAKLAIGPAIENGFYYDFDNLDIKQEDLEKIEAEMKKIVKENLKIEGFKLSREEAIELMQSRNEPYKVELINDLPEDEEISFFKQGEFVDLCVGPHLLYTKGVKAFKLFSITGAYWRGDEHNKMLQRIYATAFFDKEELDRFLFVRAEAEKRDHRKLGKELGLFMFAEEGPGFPFFLPKGMTLKNTLIDYWREIHLREGYQEVSTPVILSRKLWETSGHWDHYKENMYTTVIDEEDYAIKPMNCPGGMLVYKSQPRSYRDLPLRIGELGLVHRHEKSGQLHGLMRVRCFTQDDAHIFMTQDQITDEIKGVTRLINEVYSQFGFDYFVELSTRPEDSMGSDEDWEMATNGLRNALCGPSVAEADMLFATLDPTSRKLVLPSGMAVLLVDTVGFVSRLPHNLVEAFKSTLEEAAWSDVIIRVADAGDEQREEQLAVTDEVLDGLDCTDIPRLTVYNKCDKPNTLSFDPNILLTSAKTGYGLDTLLQKLDELLSDRVHTIRVLLPYDKLGLAAPMRERGSVQVEEYREDGLYLEGIVKTEDLHCFEGYLV